MKLDPQTLKGKKIVSIDSTSHNAWHLVLNDGTKVSLWSDNNNLYVPNGGNIPGLSLEVTEENTDVA